MMDLRTATDLLNKLRKPLSLGTMRKYFKLMTLTANDQESERDAAKKSDEFLKT